jgi:thymidylate synthase
MKQYKDIHTAYLETLKDVYLNYDYRTSPRGQPVREKLDYQFQILEPVSEPITTLDEERNRIIKDYTSKEMELYASRSNKASDFGKASKFWEKIANPDGTINSAYGYLIWENRSYGNPKYELYTADKSSFKGYRTPWEWAVDSLIADKDTRQAIIRFSLPEHQYWGNKDQTCTLSGNFLIRDDKLNLSVVMRSNDVWLGLTYDLPWFISLMDQMLRDLRHVYPNLKKGSYTHIVHSLHVYERDADKISKAIGQGSI